MEAQEFLIWEKISVQNVWHHVKSMKLNVHEIPIQTINFVHFLKWISDRTLLSAVCSTESHPTPIERIQWRRKESRDIWEPQKERISLWYTWLLLCVDRPARNLWSWKKVLPIEGMFVVAICGDWSRCTLNYLGGFKQSVVGQGNILMLVDEKAHFMSNDLQNISYSRLVCISAQTVGNLNTFICTTWSLI